MKQNTLFLDDLGMLRIPWMLLSVLLTLGAAAVAICLGVKAASEASCNQTTAGMVQVKGHRIVDGDYRFWSDTCYLTLNNGRTYRAQYLQAFEEVK